MLDDIGFGNYGTGSLNTPINTDSTAPVSNRQEKSSPLSASSIQESELEALAFFMVAGIPVLTMPDMNGNSSSVNSSKIAAASGLNVEAQTHQIISKMWESYIENIREVSERQKKEDIDKETKDANKAGPKSSAEYFTYLMSISANQRAEEISGAESTALTTQFTNTYNTWLVNPMDSGTSLAINGISHGSYPSAAFMAGCVACNPDAIRNAIGADGAILGIQLSSSPVADALLAVGPTSGLPGDYQAAAAMIAALLNGGAVNKATVDTMANPGASKPEYNLNFAINYAQQIMAIVTKNIGAEDPTNPRAAQNNMVRLMLAAMALNMVYRAGFGGMSGMDMGSLIAGDTRGLGQIKGLVEQLVALVNRYLPQDPKIREETINRLMEYVDNKESVDSMLETSGLFTSFLNASEVDSRRITSSTT